MACLTLLSMEGTGGGRNGGACAGIGGGRRTGLDLSGTFLMALHVCFVLETVSLVVSRLLENALALFQTQSLDSRRSSAIHNVFHENGLMPKSRVNTCKLSEQGVYKGQGC